jgi:membrane protease YdiL (CAAX protease family)
VGAAYLIIKCPAYGETFADVKARSGTQRRRLRFASPGYYAWAAGILALTGVLAVWAFGSIPEEVFGNPNVTVSRYEGLGLSVGIVLLVLLRETFYVALGEELLFRGLLGGVLFRRLGFAAGNALQTALFLLPHLGLLAVSLGLWSLVLVQAVVGWLLGWLRFRCGSILPGWIAHSLANALGAFAVLFSAS